MTHEEEISRSQPSAFLFLIDQSGSMGNQFGRPDKNGAYRSKAEIVASALNQSVGELINQCTKEEGLRDYFDVGMIGYGGASATFCWQGQLAGREMVPLTEVKRFADLQTVEEENEVKGKIVKEPMDIQVWVKPTATGGTPMKEAFRLAKDVLGRWVKNHPQSYPPIAINITDGAATDIESDQQLIDAAKELAAISNVNGSNILLINCHISELTDAMVLCPSRGEEVPRDPYAQVLFQMSSVLPSKIRSLAVEVLGRPTGANDQMRGMVFNGNAVTLIKFLKIGTQHATQKLKASPES